MITILILLHYIISIHCFQHIPIHSEDHQNTAYDRLNRRAVVRLNSKKYHHLFAPLGHVDIGSPRQPFKVLFDSGSTDLWVRSAECTLTHCVGLNAYNSSASSSYARLKDRLGGVSYYDGVYVEGNYCTETVAIYDFVLEKVFFIDANILSNQTGDIDGTVGLDLGSVGQGNSFLDVAKKQLDSSPVFSYYVDLSDVAGGITFGAIDIGRYNGELRWLSVIPTFDDEHISQYKYWRVKLAAVFIDNKSLDIDPIFTIFDTGSSLSLLPIFYAQTINRKLGLTRIDTGLPGIHYGMPCFDGEIPDIPSIIFKFGDVDITIFPDTYLYLRSHDSQLYCMSGLVGNQYFSSSPSDIIILGNVILRQFYSVFDYGSFKIGLADGNRHSEINSSFVISDFTNSPLGIAPLSSIGGAAYSGVDEWYKARNLFLLIVLTLCMIAVLYRILRFISQNTKIQPGYVPTTPNHTIISSDAFTDKCNEA